VSTEGSNANMNGLIRQYVPKGKSMEQLTQADCDRIADNINDRPRTRYDWRTPKELYKEKRESVHFKVDFRQRSKRIDSCNVALRRR